MNKRLKYLPIVPVILFSAAQLVRPSHANPPVTASHEIGAYAGMSEVAPIVKRACGDCHSNDTVWPSYAKVAPLSWLMSMSVKKGRRVINFSEWNSYSPQLRKGLLAAACDAASAGRMPGSAWTSLKPEAKLSKQDIQTICNAAKSGGAQ